MISWTVQRNQGPTDTCIPEQKESEFLVPQAGGVAGPNGLLKEV